MRPRIKKTLVHVLRLGICVGALWFVMSGVTLQDHLHLESGEELVGAVQEGEETFVISLDGDRERVIARSAVATDESGEPKVSYGLKTAWRNSRKSLLLFAFLIQFPVTIVAAYRLRWMLRAQRITLRFVDCVKLTFAGNFLNFATPLGSNAGDVFKAYFVTTHTDRKTEAATTIVLDRFVGLGTLILCVAVIAIISGGGSRLAEFRPYVLTMSVIGVLALLAYRSPTLRKHLVPWGWLEKLPMFGQLRRIDQAGRAFVAQKRIVMIVVTLTVILQMTCMVGYFSVAAAVSLDTHAGNVLEYFAYFYTATVIQALPGPPQGLGTVELAYRYFLSPFGGPSQILCFAFIIRLTVLFAALPGLLVALTGSYKPKSSLSPDGVSDPVALPDPVSKREVVAPASRGR